MSVDCDVLVVGAGISGLTTAFLLAKRGVAVEVIDAAPRAGGVIGTERREGLLYEHGPNSILDTDPFINEMLSELGILNERVDMSVIAAKRFLVRAHRLNAFPTTPYAFLTTSLFSPGAKLRVLQEPFIGRAPENTEESVAQFVLRRLGREFLDYAIEPFVAGVYAGDPAELSVSAAFPRLHAMERCYGSLIRGQIFGARERAKSDPKSRNVAPSFSFRDGMQTLTDALARGVGRVSTGMRAVKIRRLPDGAIVVTVERGGEIAERHAKAVVLSAPADCAAPLVRDFAPEAARALEEIPYAPIVSVVHGYRRADVAHALDGFGVLAPRVEKRRILGTLFSSSMFDGRAPENAVLFTTFIGGRRDPQLLSRPNEDLAEIVREELAALVGARGAPVFCALTRWPRAIPQYALGHLERVSRAEQAQHALPGLYLCASYRGGVAVGDCIRSGRETAEVVTAYLSPRPATALAR
jgi:protoporphyrinogen/coproporphyrinogen III oxidase